MIYAKVNYINKNGASGHVVPYFYDSKEAAKRITLTDYEILKVTSVKTIPIPSYYGEEEKAIYYISDITTKIASLREK